jgi:hypothetical protein
MPFYAAISVHVFVLEVSTSVHELLAPGIGCQKLGEPELILAEIPEIETICCPTIDTVPTDVVADNPVTENP